MRCLSWYRGTLEGEKYLWGVSKVMSLALDTEGLGPL